MSVAKIIELSAESTTSFEDAIVQGIAKASKTIHGIKSAWVKEQHVVVENNKVALYRADLAGCGKALVFSYPLEVNEYK